MPFVTAKGGFRVGKHFAGKERACMVVVDDRGYLSEPQLASVQIFEHRLAKSTLQQTKAALEN